MNSITEIAKNMCIRHNVTFRVIDKGTNKVVKEYSGHNQATNTMLTGIGHYLACGGTLKSAQSLFSAYIPRYMSLGTMGLVNQDESADHLPAGISGYDPTGTGDIAKYTAYMEQSPGYGADGYNSTMNNGRPEFGLGHAYDETEGAVGCELVTPTFLRVPISHQEVIPETNSETPETIDVVLSAMISTGALAQFRGSNDYVFITEAGLWSKQKLFGDSEAALGSGFLAGYRIKPPDEIDWDMSDEDNRKVLQENIIRVGINQVVQIIWKIQIGSVERLNSSDSATALLSNVISRDIISLAIPQGTTSIGNYVFYGCADLKSVSVPSSVTSIGEYSFAFCDKLSNVSLTNGIQSIGSYAFVSCRALSVITIPSSMTAISSTAFAYCGGLETIIIRKGQDSIPGAPWGAPNHPEIRWEP